MVVQEIVKCCKLPKVLPWLSLLDNAMEKYEMIVHQNNKDDLPAKCPGHLLTMQEKVAACKKSAMDGHDIKQEAEALTMEAKNSFLFAQQMVQANAQFSSFRLGKA